MADLAAADARTPLPHLPYLLLPDLLACALAALGPALPLRLLAFCTLLATKLHALHAHTAGDAALDFTFGTVLLQQAVAAAHFLLATRPVDDVRHERDAFRRSAREMGFARRVWWVVCYVNGPRSIGWSDQAANTPPRVHTSRWRFIRTHLLHTLWHLTIVDLAQTYQHSYPALFYRPTAARVSVGAAGALWRCANVASMMSTGYAMINVHYSLCAVLAVGAGLSGTDAWPDMFGRWADAWTVRRFWGRTWHQLLRRNVTSPGRLLAKTLGFQRGTSGSSYTQLYTAFLLSGLLHTGGDYMASGSASRFLQSFATTPLLAHSLTFFLAQALAITLEDGVIALGRRVGFKESRRTRALGYAWTFAWFAWSTAFWADLYLNAGTGRAEVLPFSMSRYVGRRMGLL
ncbi:hypothetical protein DENSPDRAFT_927349 [Dentipellis sp. KUC8613]|nr:hypothetical protein DENSPDRAFT_927349 [Dentipellis sp. KUC8613]